uniref:Uncharacterized protein n=1 Tax=Percolomonas cosmopolitus TaxID=63605 RepID=A0A7S1KRH7_9EUKA|mmetsp:Transcript_6510/g.24456  ORF Transcript_6510/g.24456 Transcript_6510/m.24456 type:complete len:219 (+) Transcript_6510:313-969(+)|eukprot:CAMPEP_0117446066 /NCGR_PEP_ID=MMETSP0759-20121206/6134_1 /TAXON_ID=63605 /ORGANISM="Percolomonas cosmopolitus, Strain WS" /LENGTH=218 /DNA_ID=CAMNT_0005238291 /DNA_START=292 /DNA_END=948 /DNA_ORIENTATION=+
MDEYLHTMHRSIYSPSRFLVRREWFEDLARVVDESKLRISTLSEIFRAFVKSVSNTSVFTFSDQHIQPVPVMFDYEDKTWTGTVDHQNALYNSVKFINIKLPNDGFVYTDKYEGSAPDELKNMSETADFVDMLLEFILNLDLDFEVMNVRVIYKTLAGRLAFYFENANADKIITIKYEYGWYDWNHASQPYLRGDDLRDRINRIKDKIKTQRENNLQK